MPDEEETAPTEGEQSWTDSVTDWVEETYEDVTGSEEAPAEEGPISVPYTEPTEDEKAEMNRQSELSALISSVCDNLKRSAEYVHHQASILSANPSGTTQAECTALAGQCQGLSGEANAAAAQLTGAGVQDSVYSVRACKDVGFRANSAAGNASAAASTEYASETERLLNAAESDLSYAVSAISGA
jgi:hypothetical protein